MNAHRTDRLLRLFTRDGRFTSPRGAKAEGRAEIRKLFTEEHRDIYKGTELVASIEKIEFRERATAIATGAYTLKGVEVMLGFEVSPEGSFTFQLARQDAGWLIAHARIFKE